MYDGGDAELSTSKQLDNCSISFLSKKNSKSNCSTVYI